MYRSGLDLANMDFSTLDLQLGQFLYKSTSKVSVKSTIAQEWQL